MLPPMECRAAKAAIVCKFINSLSELVTFLGMWALVTRIFSMSNIEGPLTELLSVLIIRGISLTRLADIGYLSLFSLKMSDFLRSQGMLRFFPVFDLLCMFFVAFIAF